MAERHGCGQAALTRIFNDMAQPRNARRAAMQMVTSMIVHRPIAGADRIWRVGCTIAIATRL
jgi:uncharacterized protein (UPF0147 family)